MEKVLNKFFNKTEKSNWRMEVVRHFGRLSSSRGAEFFESLFYTIVGFTVNFL